VAFAVKGRVRKDARLRYQEIRDDYLQSGGKIQKSVRRDFDVYFKNIRISAIGDKLNAFREWRESLERVVEYKQETLTKEIALRKMKAMKDRRKPLSPIEIAKIENDPAEWVEKGVQTTTDERLVPALLLSARTAKAHSTKRPHLWST